MPTPSVNTFSDLLITEATKSNLTHWMRKGVIVPVFPQPAGTGHHKQLGFRNMVEARIAVFLNAVKMPIAPMKVILDHFRFVDDASNSTAADQAGFIARAASYFQEPHAAEQLAYVVRRWTIAKTPQTRHRMYYGLTFNLTDAQVSVTTVSHDEHFVPEQHLGPASIVLNLGALLSELEARTGDQLPGGLTPEQIAGVFQR